MLFRSVRTILQRYIFNELGRYAESCKSALDELDDILAGDSTTLFTGSLGNLFNVPDFQNIGRFKALFSVLEQESSLVELIRKCSDPEGIKVVIGEEHEMPEMRNCSVVMFSTTTEGERTMLGVIGPKRMNYEKVISVLDRVLQDLVECNDEVEE